MNTRLLNLWDRCSGSFWFPPALLVAIAATLGFLLPTVESHYLGGVKELPWLATTPEGARTVLSVIAGAMITVSGVIFSVTMATLSIASSQFGSRVLRQRMRNRATQLAFGTFLGTSVFCFLVLRSVEQAEGETFVPDVSVALGIAAAVASVFVLIYFIHDVAEAVQAPHVVSRLAADLNDSVDRLYPEHLGLGDTEIDAPDEDDLPVCEGEPSQTIDSEKEGYLQAIDGDSLLEAASRNEVVIQLLVRPGGFLMEGDPVAKIWGDGEEAKSLRRVVNEAIIVGTTRTPRQDVNCAVHELAQMTIRALSPGINDPFTAMNGIDRLAAALSRLVQRKIPSKCRFDQNGELRVVADRVTFPESLAAAFNQIRQHARSSPPVGVRLLEGLESIARRARREADCDALLQQAKMVLDAYQLTEHLAPDLQGLQDQFERVQTTLDKRRTTEADGAAQTERQPDDTDEPDLADSDQESDNPPAEGEING